MKAVIVDKEGKHAIALTKKGEFIKLKDKESYRIGHEIDIASVFSYKGMFVKITAAAASILLVMGIGCGVYSYAMPYSYISIDINPSIEITTNIYDRIISAKGLNDEGKKVLSTVSVKNKAVEEAVGSILQSAINSGYLGEDSGKAVKFTIAGKNEHKVDVIEEKIEIATKEQLVTSNVETEVIVEKIPVEKHSEAENSKTSSGKETLPGKPKESNADMKAEGHKGAAASAIAKGMSGSKRSEDEKAEASEKPGKGFGRNSNSLNSKDRDDKSKETSILRKNKSKADEDAVEGLKLKRSKDKETGIWKYKNKDGGDKKGSVKGKDNISNNNSKNNDSRSNRSNISSKNSSNNSNTSSDDGRNSSGNSRSKNSGKNTKSNSSKSSSGNSNKNIKSNNSKSSNGNASYKWK
ncbi:anti-sigma factor domain-containing protein [Clostridium thermosuccinogenes]|uniref:anti-sigma factor domain-containing protein n=1 Tax=Clostridium thermosuccinogenes TaxID=84032 RepID=UPI000E3C2005|nr:anti-sigma factor domain-containing protein [Pseudoclostridium thermosuccinogenes]